MLIVSHLEFFLHPRDDVPVQPQSHLTLPQPLPVGEEADPDVSREQDIDDEDDAVQPIKPVHYKDQLHHRAQRKQN